MNIKSLIVIMTTLFFLSNHPLSMILYLILLTIFASLSISFMLSFPWFSYILILILLGAMLIIFLYMASLAPNEIMSTNWKPFLLFLMITFPLYFLSPHFNKANYLNSGFLFSTSASCLTIITASYLLITMIAIVKISSLSKGPMKSN